MNTEFKSTVTTPNEEVSIGAIKKTSVKKKKKRRLKKLIGKATSGSGLTLYSELKECCEYLSRNDENTKDTTTTKTASSLMPRILLASQVTHEKKNNKNQSSEKKKKKEKKRKAQDLLSSSSSSLDEPSVITTTTTSYYVNQDNNDNFGMSNQTCTGSDVRDLIVYLLMQQQQQQPSSFSRKEKTRKIPSWAIIRNIVSCRNVAVVEFSLNFLSSSPKEGFNEGGDGGGIQYDFPLHYMLDFLKRKQEQQEGEDNDDEKKKKTPESSRSSSVLLNLLGQVGNNEDDVKSSDQQQSSNDEDEEKKNHNNTTLSLDTILFDKNTTSHSSSCIPTSITDVLMYDSPSSLFCAEEDRENSSKKNKKKQKIAEEKNDVSSTPSLSDKLLDMCLSDHELFRFGYPVCRNADSINKKTEISMNDIAISDPIIIGDMKRNVRLKPLQKAVSMVNDLHVPIHIRHDEQDCLGLDLGSSANNDEENNHKLLYVETLSQNEQQQQTNSTVSSSSSSSFKIYGLDCEMVKTLKGSELARVTLVRVNFPADNVNQQQQQQTTASTCSYTFETVLDILVKPYNPILDYVTQYSGMTPQLLNPIQIRIEQVQIKLLEIIQKDDILIGHSLENDLKVLGLIHHRIIDTAVLFSFDGGDGSGTTRKFSLLHLAQVLLQKTIRQKQNNDVNNIASAHHCSEEDAITAVELALQRGIEGDSFQLSPSQCYHTRNNIERRKLNVLHKMEQYVQMMKYKEKTKISDAKTTPSPSDNEYSCALEKYPGSFVCIGPSDWLSQHVLSLRNSTAHTLICDPLLLSNNSSSNNNSDKWKAIPAFLRSSNRPASLVWTHLDFQNDETEKKNKHKSKQTMQKDTEQINNNKNIQNTIEQVERIMNYVIDESPSTSLLLFVFQNGTQKVRELREKKRLLTSPKNRSSIFQWNDDMQNKYMKALEQSRYANAIWVRGKKEVSLSSIV